MERTTANTGCQKVENNCFRLLANSLISGIEDCFTGMRGPSYAIADNGGLLEKTSFNSVKECADRCTLLPHCQAWEYFGQGDEQFRSCFLYKSGKLSGYLDDGRKHYASVCPKSGTATGTNTM